MVRAPSSRPAGATPDGAYAPEPRRMLWRRRFDWTFFTEPQEHLGGRRMHWPRGKVLGGTSSPQRDGLHARPPRRTTTRGAPRQPGLGLRRRAAVLQAVRGQRARRVRVPRRRRAARTSTTRDADAGRASAFVEATAARCRRPASPTTSTAPSRRASGCYQVTTRDGPALQHGDRVPRSGARARPNLTVITGALATRSSFDGERAAGVRYAARRAERRSSARDARSSSRRARSARRTCCCCRASARPTSCARVGVDVVHDLPGVGKHLQDHLLRPARLAATRRASPTTSARLNAASGWIGRTSRATRGPLGARTPPMPARSCARAADAAAARHLSFTSCRWASPDARQEAFAAVAAAFATCCRACIYPKSHGEIRLRSADPAAPPAIDPRYFSDVRRPRRTSSTASSSRGDRARHAARPDARGERSRRRASAETTRICATRSAATCNTIFHPVGTCKMGSGRRSPSSTPSCACAASRGLRVVDASIMPTIVGGNTNAPTIMIAEKAADLVRGRPSPL